MKPRTLGIGLAFLALLASYVVSYPTARAQQSPPSNGFKAAFSTSSNGPSAVYGIVGYSSCGLNVDNISGAVISVYVTNDANPSPSSQWVLATGINSGGAISTTGIFTGNVAASGLTGMYFVVTGLSSGSVSGSVGCSIAGNNVFTGTISGTVTAKLSPYPVQVYPSPNPWPVTTPAPLPGYTASPTLPFPAVGMANPANGLAYTSGSPLPVTTAPPPAVGPTSSPGNVPLYNEVAPNASPYPTDSSFGAIARVVFRNSSGLVVPDIYDNYYQTAAAITTATTTLVAAVSAGKAYHIVSLIITATGANSSAKYQFITGTQTTTPCDTGASNIGPPVYAQAAVGADADAFPPFGAIFPFAVTGTSAQVCVTSSGTTMAALAGILADLR